MRVRIVSFNAQTSKFSMVVIVKLLDYEWKDKFSLIKAKLECDCGHVFTMIVL